MLELQKYLQTKSPEDLTKELFIDVKPHKEYPNLLLFKYSQIDSPMSNPIVQECRGIILDKDNNWNIVSYPYKKFFNAEEPNASVINWETANVYEKLDGCCDENTILITDIGNKTIKEVCENKLICNVLCQDVDTGENIYAPISGWSIKENSENKRWFKIISENGKEVILTENHYVWLPKLNCYRKVIDLKEGDEVEIVE